MQSQSLPFGILTLSNSHTGLTATKSRTKTQQQQQQGGQQLTPILVTNPMLRASHDGGQRKGADEDKGKSPTKGKSTFTGDKTPHYMFDVDELGSQPIHGEPDVADPNSTLLRDEQGTVQSTEESEGEEGQIVAAPPAKKHRPSNPYHPGCCGALLYASTQHKYPKDLPRELLSSSRNGYPDLRRRRTHRKRSKH